MKKFIILFAIVILTSCVQKTKKHSVTLLLDVSAMKDIKSVGVRGNDKPFSWDNDVEMEVVKKDSLYKTTFTIETGRICTEIKFTVNGNFELQDKNNRKIYFNQNGETVYKAKFDLMK
jgi:PBP1b-binding outer membrane lipoprotein LpoB